MRAIALTESRFAVCCSVHDSFKVLAPLDRLDRTLIEVTEIMHAAGAAVTGSFGIPAKIKTPFASRTASRSMDCGRQVAAYLD